MPSSTAIERPKVSEPPEFIAVTTWSTSPVTAVGEPVMAPVDAFNDSPAGNAGLIDQLTTVPAVEVGTTFTVLPVVKV